MKSQIAVPPGAPQQFLEELKIEIAEAVATIASEVARGKLEASDAGEAIGAIVAGGIDAAGTLLDVTLAFEDPMPEAMSDAAIAWGVKLLKDRVAPVVTNAVKAADDAIGYNPLRAAGKLGELLSGDLEDGVVGDDKVRRVYRIARRIVEKSPGLARELGVGFDGKQLRVNGGTWGKPPRGFRAPKLEPELESA